MVCFNADEGFVLDLLGLKTITGVALRNTHNANYNDFGTRGFTILGTLLRSSYS